MKSKLLLVAMLLCSVLCVLALSGCKKSAAAVNADTAFGAYDAEADWNDAAKTITLGYQQSQGKRVFYQYCVWCHADATPAGPSNRNNVTPAAAADERRRKTEWRKRRVHAEHNHAGRQRDGEVRDDAALWKNLEPWRD